MASMRSQQGEHLLIRQTCLFATKVSERLTQGLFLQWSRGYPGQPPYASPAAGS
jgi:hypothetical protein